MELCRARQYAWASGQVELCPIEVEKPRRRCWRSAGQPDVPSGGLITLIVVLQSVGQSGSGHRADSGADRILDMLRTGVNVTGNLAQEKSSTPA
jgi:hypothetical protein